MIKTEPLNKILGGLILIFMLFCTKLGAGDLMVSWNPNQEDDLAGYKVYYGTAPRDYPNVLNVGNVTEHIIKPKGIWFIYVWRPCLS